MPSSQSSLPVPLSELKRLSHVEPVDANICRVNFTDSNLRQRKLNSASNLLIYICLIATGCQCLALRGCQPYRIRLGSYSPVWRCICTVYHPVRHMQALLSRICSCIIKWKQYYCIGQKLAALARASCIHRTRGQKFNSHVIT